MPTLRFRVLVYSLFLVAAYAPAQSIPASQPPVWSARPSVSDFEKLENERLTSAQQAIDRLIAVTGAHTLDNTLVPFDEAVRLLNTAGNLASLLQQVHPDTAFRDSATAMTTKVSSAQTALSLNRDVYKALSALDLSKTDAATRYYVERQLLEFRLSGVDKDDATREKLHKLQDQLTESQSNFERNIADGTVTVDVADPSELDGLPQDYIENHKPGADGKIHITTNYPDLFPVLTFAKSDSLRRRMGEARQARAYPKNREVISAMMQERYAIAQLLGYNSWADLNAADKMIRNGANIAKFIADLDASTRPIAEREYAILLAEKRKTDPAATEIISYEGYRLSELVRRAKYNFDSQEMRPYLPFSQVKQGVMNTAATLFHVSFKQEMNIPSWDPAVETWDVIESGKAIGRFYLDMHPRPGKYSHAEMAPILDGIKGKQLPEAILVCNFPVPTATDPGLMEFSDAVTFFHEFGHLMHHILGGQQQWAGIAGISMESDFVEAPSQMLEEWMHSPQVLATFARHYKTGEPIPAELVARMNRASAFGRATGVMGQNALSAISYDLYKEAPEKVNLDTIVKNDLLQHTLSKPLEADAHMYASFNHLAGYSSAYYTYMWDKVIAEDFFQQFDQKNMLAGDAPMRYRRAVLEPGGSVSANDLVKNFLGRPQNTANFQKWLGQEFEDQPKGK